jgi:hypothetical protein
VDPDTGSGSRVLMTKNLKKFKAENFFIIFFGSKIAIYLSLGLYKGRPSYRRSLQPSKRTSSNSKHEISLPYFLWVIFALLDPDPDPATQIIADPCGFGSGSATLRKRKPVDKTTFGRMD